MSFLEAIRIRNTTNEYYKNAFFAKLHRAEMSPLEDILGIPLEETTPFDEETDAKMERYAKQMLEHRKLQKNV